MIRTIAVFVLATKLSQKHLVYLKIAKINPLQCGVWGDTENIKNVEGTNKFKRIGELNPI